MLRLVLLSVLAIVGCSSVGCSSSTKPGDPNVLRVGASPVPHAIILEQVKPVLAAQGITLQVTELLDYLQPNVAVDSGDLDANFFQHQPYLDRFNADRKTDLVSVARVHVEPLGVYSVKVTALSSLKDGAVVAIPNDPTNAARALALLQVGGLIMLDPKAVDPTVLDVVGNPKKLVIKELEAAQLARVLQDVDAAVINANYVLETGLDPQTALLKEAGSSRFANIVAVKRSLGTDKRVQALVASLADPSLAAFIDRRFKGAVVPAQP